MSVSPYPPVFTPDPSTERVAGSTPMLPTPYSSPIQAAPSTSTGGNVSSDQWTQYMQQLQQQIDQLGTSLTANSGYSRWALEQQYADAQKGRDNALALEQARDQTTRYGADLQDQQSKNALNEKIQELQQNAQQFEQNHQLSEQQFAEGQRQFNVTSGQAQENIGLNRANTETQYLSSPDRALQADQYLNLSGRILAGQPGAAPAAVSGTPTPNTEAGFAALQAGGAPATGGQSATAGASTDTSPAGVAARAAGAGGAGADGRVKALKAVIDAAPPSTQPGLNDNDNAVLAAARALYSTNLNPQQFAAIQSDPGTAGVNKSAQGMLGIDNDSWIAQNRRNGIGQSSSMAA